MPYYRIQWTLGAEDDIPRHGVTVEEFQEVVFDPDQQLISGSGGRRAARDWIGTGSLLFCVYGLDADGVTLFPVTSHEIGD